MADSSTVIERLEYIPLPDDAKVLLDDALAKLNLTIDKIVEISAHEGNSVDESGNLWCSTQRIIGGSVGSATCRVQTWTYTIEPGKRYLEWHDTHWVEMIMSPWQNNHASWHTGYIGPEMAES